MRFPEVRQHDSMQCGAACLAMICEHWSGKIYTLDEMERHCGASHRGVSMLAVSEAGKELGFRTKGVQLTAESLHLLPMPAILHWNQNHFVVLYKIKNNKRFYISDPGSGLMEFSREEFCEKWESGIIDNRRVGSALTMEPTDKFISSSKKERRSSRSLAFLLKYLSRNRGAFTKIALMLAIGSGLQLIMPFLTQAIVDYGINDRNLSIIWLILLGEMLIVAGRTVSDFVRSKILLNISMKVNVSLMLDFFTKLMNLPMSFFETRLTGDIFQRMGDHGRIQHFLTNQVLGVAFSVISFFIYGIVLSIYSLPVFSIFIIGSIIYALWISFFLKRRKKLDYEMFDCQAINQSATYQMVTCMPEIKLQGCKKRRKDEWEKIQMRLFDIRLRSLHQEQTQQAGSILINEVKNILITVAAAGSVINGNITLGGMLAIQYIVGQLSSPVSQLLNFINSLQDVKISFDRISEVHEIENEEGEINTRTEYASDCHNIRISGLNFKYNRHALRKALDGVSIEIPEGKFTAIVGESGSGKSTLIKLLLGYYRVESGEILVSGAPLYSYNLEWWRSRCGIVTQDGVIFTESVARNIAVGDDEPDMNKIREAASIANIDDFISGLPNRYETIIGKDGLGISQGQKQRILIARAVYKNPNFIFFDEATNSLDAKNEREIVRKLECFYKGRTAVVVAHRLSTVMDADQIIVMDNGRVVEVGTHDELTARKGKYYNLVKNQLELGL